MTRWRILHGIHVDRHARPVKLVDIGGIDRKPLDHADWQDPEKPKTFYAGDIIKTDRDLSKHNHPGSVRFERLSESEASDELARMTIDELRALAEAEQIEAPAGLKKAQLVEAVRGAREYQAAVA